MRSRFFSRARARWLVIAALWVGLFVLGIGGFRQQATVGHVGRSNLDILYLIFQLITLQYNGADAVLNWRLEIARFLAPALAFSTVLQSASLVFADEFRRLRLQYVRNHTVVCGLGDVGTRLAQAFAMDGGRVVAIESDPSSSGVASAKAAGVTVLIGDASDPALLRTARVAQAVRLIAVCGNDATNVQIASQAVPVVDDRPGKALRCAVHLDDAEMATLLRAADLDQHGSVRMSFFNTHERAARALLSEHSPFAVDRLGHALSSHVVLFGLGQLGRSLVVNMAQQWAEISPIDPLRITIVDEAASGRWAALRLGHPALDEGCDPQVLDFDLKAPTAEGVDALQRSFAGRDGATWVVVAYADESLSLSTALFLHQSLGVRKLPIIVRTRTEVGLGALLIPGESRSDAFPTMRAFPFLDRTCTIDAIDAGVREQLARAVHEDYLLRSSDGVNLAKAWDELDDDERDLSRRRVDGILGDLASIGCELGPLRRWGAPSTTFSEAEIEQLAEREHIRWHDDRLEAGWTYGDARDNDARKNPMLVPWEDLPDDARAMNVTSVRALPMMLARAGFEAVRADIPT
ncbi:MAG: RyR protein [Ilumatobacteraceae bacterium]|nr:RyR protein [Ilumatobacteraceae bacterium]